VKHSLAIVLILLAPITLTAFYYYFGLEHTFLDSYLITSYRK
jgi:hypothetical protein